MVLLVYTFNTEDMTVAQKLLNLFAYHTEVVVGEIELSFDAWGRLSTSLSLHPVPSLERG